MRERRRWWGALSAVLVVAAIWPASTVAAAPITFSLSVGERCVFGTKPAGGTLTATLLAPNGTQRAQRKDTAGGTSWTVCFKVTPRPGDRIRAVRGSVRRTIVVPHVTTSVDRATDVVSGRAPDGRRLTIQAQHCSLSGDCDMLVSRTVRANDRGRYRKDMSSALDVRGADAFIVFYKTSAGDTFGATGFAPYMLVTGLGKVAVMCAGSADRVIILRRADGRERARAAFPGPQGCDASLFTSFRKRFRRGDEPVSPSVGNIVRSDLASDARFTWPGIALEVDVSTVSGRCFPDAGYTVAVLIQNPGGGLTLDRLVTDTTASDGTFSEALKPGTSIALTDRVRLACESPRGDRVVTEIRVEIHS